jgi:hypothetical protein
VYVSGYRQKPGFGSGSNSLLTKFNSAGTIQWQRDFAYNTGDIVSTRGTAVDSSGNLYAVLYAAILGTRQAVVVKYNSSGTIQWQRTLTPFQFETSFFIRCAVDTSGNLIVSYRVGGSFGGGVLVAVIKFDGSGNILWQRQMSLNSVMRGVSTDSSNNIYILVDFRFGTGIAQPTLIKYNSSGVLQWTRRFRYTTFTTENLYLFFMAIRDNNIVMGGQAINTDRPNFDAYGFTGYNVNAFVVKVPTDGSKTGTYTTGGGIPAIIYESVALTEASGTFTSTASSFFDDASNLATSSGSSGDVVVPNVQYNSVII